MLSGIWEFGNGALPLLFSQGVAERGPKERTAIGGVSHLHCPFYVLVSGVGCRVGFDRAFIVIDLTGGGIFAVVSSSIST